MLVSGQNLQSLVPENNWRRGGFVVTLPLDGGFGIEKGRVVTHAE
jgi:hypothetical protein